MTQYLISFDDGAMTFPQEDLPEVDRAAHAVVEKAKAVGVWVFGGGLTSEVTVVATDGSVGGPYPENTDYVGGFSVVDVRTRDEAIQWAAKLAAACRPRPGGSRDHVRPEDVRGMPVSITAIGSAHQATP